MKNTAAAYALNKAEQFAKLGADLTHLKSNFASVSKHARRAVRKGRRAAAEFVDESALCVKKQPWKALGFTLGAGVAIGAIGGWLAARK
jgi:ElaB/YqjD/DUF883 family membrane-anchored ribosome-binding protein